MRASLHAYSLPNQKRKYKIACELVRLKTRLFTIDGTTSKHPLCGALVLSRHHVNAPRAFKMHITFGRRLAFSMSFQTAIAPLLAPLSAAILLTCNSAAHAQNLPVTPTQKATASQVATNGVPLSELAPNAPDSYTVKRGDTLWALSGLFLKSPWRWPELWGMNLSEIRNPHLIYPGQALFLEKSNGRATLRMRRAAGSGMPTDTVRLSPQTRYENLSDMNIPALSPSAIEPFLAEALIVDEASFALAPRIVATRESRVLLSRGDRGYARSTYSGVESTVKPLSIAKGEPINYRVYRNATALKDPTTKEILGYEAQYVGRAELVRGESVVLTAQGPGNKDTSGTEIVPATIDITSSKEEMLVGDRLVAEPPRELLSYVPRAPTTAIAGQVVSVYGSNFANAASNQIVVLNKGNRDGLERGHVMALVSDGVRLTDKTDISRPAMKLPNERNGLMMVFRTFDKLSYALILEVSSSVQVGDRFVNPN